VNLWSPRVGRLLFYTPGISLHYSSEEGVPNIINFSNVVYPDLLYGNYSTVDSVFRGNALKILRKNAYFLLSTV
jgi:hypothetical protein